MIKNFKDFNESREEEIERSAEQEMTELEADLNEIGLEILEAKYFPATTIPSSQNNLGSFTYEYIYMLLNLKIDDVNVSIDVHPQHSPKNVVDINWYYYVRPNGLTRVNMTREQLFIDLKKMINNSKK